MRISQTFSQLFNAVVAWRPLMFSSLRVAVRGERLAARYLRRKGYRVLAKNVRNRFGEIDLVARAPDHETLVIVEVKSRLLARPDRSHATPRPEIHVNHRKQRQLVALACQFARRSRCTQRAIRFDVVGIDLVTNGHPVVRHHVGAFESHV